MNGQFVPRIGFRRTRTRWRLCEPTVGLARRRRNLQLQSVRWAIRPGPFFSSAALRRKKKQTRNTDHVAQESWPRRHKADGGQEELDGGCVSLPSGLPGGGVTCSYRVDRGGLG